MKIIVSGLAKLNVPYEVELNMSAEEWEELSQSEQDDILDSAIDWKDACRSADVDEIDVFDIEEEED